MSGHGLYFSDPACLAHDPRRLMPGHPDAPERLSAIELELARHDWLGWERRSAPPASERELELVHSRGYIEALRDFCARGGGALDADTFADELSYDAALQAAGAACAMTRALVAGAARVGFCAVRPPGHHAERGRAMGFCLFNSVASAAALAISELGLERVLIVDWDVHHGNGTAEAFRERREVLYASIHQRGLFPGTGAPEDVGSGRGEGFTINLPVSAGAGEEEWLALLAHVLLPAARAFEPQLVLISAGFDAHRADPLASCRLEAGSFAEMARHVRAEAERLRAPIGAVLEGGYEPSSLADSVRQTMAALAGEGQARPTAPERRLTDQARARIGRYWSL
jgi:acetoin utilization deacetylase AcuC-like enzyme